MKEKTTVCSPFLGAFPSDYILKEYIHLFTVAIPVNYTSEFREFFEATTYEWLLYQVGF
jgi:hypothetical protein